MRLKKLWSFILFFFLLAAGFAADYYYKLQRAPLIISSNFNNASQLSKLQKLSAQLAEYNHGHNFNEQLCFLADMSLPSGKNRFFIYDLKKQHVLESSLVTHGRCNKQWLTGRQYSNNIGSGCTSLGKYKVGKSYMGKFGLAYKLYGLESTNNNAFNRYVVLHSHECVPEREIDPYPICQSDGCPTVSPLFLKKLQLLIKSSNKPILLWILE